jgi:hypothetical protein
MNNSKFAFRCYFKLKNNLGRFDSIVECNELAIRQFLSLLIQSNREKVISELSSKHGIRVNNLDSDLFQSRISQWYILSVYQ